ncbi:Glutathione amide reductase [Enhygromyxa salina]|uniref:Glutathione reductase n=1 Tax=Enhygromyxa salina TaxID=215803 RepID=A0A2S9XAZ1_9BACT|nr:glutathione-disulfide reductase [Enhygromyxa salina]PRP90026.1 Glutathione amide reductase [Enhygromyxa salina]
MPDSDLDFDFDLFTIGAGSGGVAASRRAGEYGARVAICEELRIGGTCVMRGCVPKKLLMYGASFSEHLEDATGFGWEVGEPTLDWPKLMAAKEAELDRLENIYRRLLADSKVALIEGRGRLIDAHTVEVAGKRYTAKYILIATGGWPALPQIPGIEHAITSNEALELEQLPKRLTIVGGGYIGVEFAGIFSAAGSRVTMLLRGDNVLRGFDSEIRERLAEAMRARGIEINTEVQVRSIDKRSSGALSLLLDHDEFIETDALIYATGRAPNSRDIGLEEVGVKLRSDGGVVVDERNRTAVPNIYAVGDVTHRINLTPVAINEGRAMAETLFNKNPIIMDRRNIATAVFSRPPVGTVGLTEAEAREQHESVEVYCSRFRPMKATISGREDRVVVKLVVDKPSGVVLGAHMIGDDAPEIVQGLAVAIKCGATKRDFDATVGIHPTAAEEFVTMRFPVPED